MFKFARHLFGFAACALTLLLALAAHAAIVRSPFGIVMELKADGEASLLQVTFKVPTDCVLYSERLHFLSSEGNELIPVKIPEPLLEYDKASKLQKKVYDHDFIVALNPIDLTDHRLVIKFQGCTNDACFFPEKRTFSLNADKLFAEELTAGTTNVPANASASLNHEINQFNVISRATGYMSSGDFVSFLNKALSGGGPELDDPLAKFKKLGLVATVFLIMLGGLSLNLTPCILPLIPINLAIIHGGKAAHSRREGFLHGAAYGAGMALAYGILGLVVVLTGSKFGTLNSSVWFNLVIALVFIVMALSMFDVFHIDFTRFDRGLGKRESKVAHRTRSQWLVAFTMGAIAALLAGACVAPVVISVILLATNLYGQGVVLGLALPFLLGIGMALPWPFMGASLSFLPQPGKWMVWVKYSFGALILLFALYYGHTAYGLGKSARTATTLASAPAGTSTVGITDPNDDLIKALQAARAQGKAVFVDFKASWCKNCLAMDETVFNRTNVRQQLSDFIVVNYDAERPNESPARDILDRFKILGLPTYLILKPIAENN